VSIMQKLTDMVKSLTSDKANADPSPGARVPATDEGAVPMDRQPAVGFEPKHEE